ncbi:MAG TPA: hypothetical protein VMT16_14255 [Thermoanaerobaculia bacterium]|nr:hypothetical protein [Thermoanaerobaculia bacterium]
MVRAHGWIPFLVPVFLLTAGCGRGPQAAPAGEGAAGAPAWRQAELRQAPPPAGAGAMAPQLTVAGGEVLLSWIEPLAGGAGEEHRLLIAELEVGSGTWSAPHEITRGKGFFANWADLPAVAAGADRVLVAHWLEKLGAGPYAYGAQLARSTDGGVGWERMGLLHDDASPTEHGFVSWVPVDGGLQAFWLDGRAMEGGDGGHDGHDGHGGPAGGGMQLRTALVAEGEPQQSALLDDRVCECCATDAALTAAGPVVVYRDRSESEIRDIAIVRQTPQGWSGPAIVAQDGWEIAGCPVNGPAVAADGEQVVVAWFTASDATPQVLAAFSTDGGASFGEPVVVDGERPLGRVAVALAEDGGAFVSWLGSKGEGAELRLARVGAGGPAGEARGIADTTARRAAGVPRMVRAGDDLVFAWVEDVEPSRLAAAVLPAPR